MTRTFKIASEACTFEEFEQKFDRYVIARTGMGYQDFSDFPIRDCYDNTLTLGETYSEMLSWQDEGEDFLESLFG